MSNKSGISSQVISLPSGGGALQGIGETFSPDLFTGTGNFSVPLALPPGRNGFGPQLSLSYSTGNGNGPFGLGWDLSVPGVSRKTSKGVPRYRDTATDANKRDTFLLSGAEDLVQVAEQQGIARFRPRTEGLFARIEHIQDANNNFWRVRSRDGLVSLYGTPASAGNDPAVVADPDNHAKAFCWKLAQTTDPFGNRIEYTYLRDRDQDGPHGWDQLYLEHVQYIDFEHDGATHFLVSVTFHYEQRPDPFSSYRSGFEMRTRLRCKRIEIRTHADSDRLARTYELVYLDERLRADDANLPRNGVSLLSQIRVVGHDGERVEEFPPLEFGYTRFAPERQRFQPITAVNNALPPRSLADDDFEMVDLFGNGLPDIVQMNGFVQFWRNLGGGHFDRPQLMPEVPAGVHLRDPGVQFGDMNGDGRADLLVLPQKGYFPLSFQGRWSPQGFVQYTSTPSVAFGDDTIRLVDLDGDGVVDALHTSVSFELFFNDPLKGWETVETRPRRPLEEFPDLTFADPRVKLADLTGDGLQDFVFVNQGQIDYWPYFGHGRWGRRISTHLPKFNEVISVGDAFHPERILLGDLDGDGLDDIVYIESNRLTFWINQGGERWSEPITIAGSPPLIDVDAVRMADMLGTGMAGVLWSLDQIAGAGSNYQFLDLTGGIKPYVLSEMNNNMGAITRVEYASSIEFYLADFDDPDRRWKTYLPFPVQVVKRVEVIDALSKGKLTTEYRYHHGYWDGAEREFRGFGMVEQFDTETFERFNEPGLHGNGAAFSRIEQAHFSPPTLTKKWFHLGPIGDEFRERREADFSSAYWPDDLPVFGRALEMEVLLGRLPVSERANALRALRGSILRTELYALDGTERENRPYTVTESQYSVREESVPAANDMQRRRIFFPHLVAQRTTQWERGADPMAQFSFTDGYDEYGLSTGQTTLAVPRRRDFRVPAAATEPYLGTHTTVTYARRDDEGSYIVNRVAGMETFEILNDGSQPLFDVYRDVQTGNAELTLIGQSFNYYDGTAFVGEKHGVLGDFGTLVRSETLVLTEPILRAAYKDRGTENAPDFPPYLDPNGTPNWTGEYPQEFRTLRTGYDFADGSDHHTRGYFVQTARTRYDFHDPASRTKRGLPLTIRDLFGNDTSIAYDVFTMMPTKVIDAVRVIITAEYDYRVMQPRLVTDLNGNRTEYRFMPLGLLQEIFVRGKAGMQQGDGEEAGTRFEHDLLAFLNSPADARQPIFVRTIRREHHDTETDVDAAERDATVQTIEFSDGFGRLLQTRTQAEDVLFGDAALDAPLFGNDVLPADQRDSSATQAPVIGRKRDKNDPPHVVVSGWQIYDNKGQVVEKFEPFFSKGFEYLSPDEEQALFGRDVLGRTVTILYDPRGQVISTVNPDGGSQRVIYGVPGTILDPDLSNSDIFEPTPWEAYTYDANDNAARTHPADPRISQYRHHQDTPASIVIDALGRTVLAVERNRVAPGSPNGPLSPIKEHLTRSIYDIRGNLLTLTDALGRETFRYTYDLANNPLRIENIDAGVRRVILDAAGNEIERRDSKGALILQIYDVLNRPIRLWARDGGNSPITLREQLVYGDGGDPNQPPEERTANRAANRLGKLHQHYDEAGLLAFEAYDFKGNPLEKVRRTIRDEEILAVFAIPQPDGTIPVYRVDWQPPAVGTLADRESVLLDSTEYQTSTTYDALNRVKTMRYPQDVDGERKELRPHYNRAGALERVELAGQTYVEHIAYNVKGQRTLVALGNGVMTRYAYDPRTFRLLRLRSERYTHPDPPTYQPAGGLLQDFAYEYDLVGNILRLTDRVSGSGVQDNPEAALVADPALRALVAAGDALVRHFGYDAMYRLTSATGRECRTMARPEPWFDDPQRCGFSGGNQGMPNRGNAPNLTTVYSEAYTYDPVGNITRLRHATRLERFIRQFSLVSGTNRLNTVIIGETNFAYIYDPNGNLTNETSSRHFEWDHSDQMKAFRTQAGASEPSVHAHYLYDAGGQRVKKLARRQGGRFESTTYIDGIFEHQHWQGNGGQADENDYLHVMDDSRSRIALVRVGTPHPDERGPAVQYHLGDHLGSSNLVVNKDGSFINREEYTPYGETSFGSFARKRYRFTGKERDEESGLNYYGARYYATWLGRWTSSDPAGMADGSNLYMYAGDNPVRSVDLHGLQSTDQVHTNTDEEPRHTTIPPIVGEGKTVFIKGEEFVNIGGAFRPVPGQVKLDDLAFSVGLAWRGDHHTGTGGVEVKLKTNDYSKTLFFRRRDVDWHGNAAEGYFYERAPSPWGTLLIPSRITPSSSPRLWRATLEVDQATQENVAALEALFSAVTAPQALAGPRPLPGEKAGVTGIVESTATKPSSKVMRFYHHTSIEGGLGINQTGIIKGSRTPGLWRPWRTGDVYLTTKSELNWFDRLTYGLPKSRTNAVVPVYLPENAVGKAPFGIRIHRGPILLGPPQNFKIPPTP